MTPRSAARAALLVTSLATFTAFADPPAPKVCVAVAGDPDESMRASAETLADAIAHREGLRGVADADARAALRGDSLANAASATDVADLSAARRSLRGEDRDATALDAVSSRLGCGLVVELMARPAGALVRVYDPVQHTWPVSRELPSIDAATLDAVVLPTLAHHDAPVASSDASTPADASVNADASSSNGAAVTAVGAANTAQPANAQNPSAAGRSGANDRRVTTAQPESRSVWTRAWPWIAVGGVALAVVGAYFLAQEGSTTSTTRVTVVHPGAP
jgi:hypothetical protein